MTARGGRTLLTLPAEIRLHILDYVFEDVGMQAGSDAGRFCSGLQDTTATKLYPLLSCRRIYLDGRQLAFTRTPFVCSNLFVDIPSRLRELPTASIVALRSVAFVADARHFRKLVDWGSHPFGVPGLQLDQLSLILHRSSCWHYLFDFTTDVVKLLRHLSGVRRLVIVRNDARVKGSFKTWCNRLVGLMMKFDHHERYLATTPNCETVWWTWTLDDIAQSFCLEAAPPKPWVDEQTYLQNMLPLVEMLRISVETEEWNPDPRSRNGA